MRLSSTPEPELIGRRARRRASRRTLRRGETFWGIVYATPAILLILAFLGYPLGSIAYHAFTRWSGLASPQWVGFHNFSVLWKDPIFRKALKNNFLFAITVP